MRRIRRRGIGWGRRQANALRCKFRHPEVRALRASKDERPRCSRAVALRGLRFAPAPQGDGDEWEDAAATSLRAKRSNPESFRGGSLDCFAALAMTVETAAYTFPSTITSISFVPGRLNADASVAFSSLTSLTLIASQPSALARPVKSTGGFTKSMPT
ncbi:hypothetical protein ACVIW2_006808 [Bradyrhizobium huanghuaihaiense]